MNILDPALPPVRGLVGGDGRLVEAEPRLLDLNARAGGTIGEPLAVPQLAGVARLAQRLGILVSRGVIAADGPDELDLWVRAEPGEAGVRLAVTGWRSRPGWPIGPADEEQRSVTLLRAEGDWSWAVDAGMNLTAVSAEASRQGVDVAAVLGRPLTTLFALGEDDTGVQPILSGLALHQPFTAQPAEVRAGRQAVLLSAVPRFDGASRFAGYEGTVRLAPGPARADVFGQRLGHALRAPLGRIIANADSINAQSDGPIRKDYVDYAADIASAGRHLLGLVDDLVDLQAIERPDFRPLAEPIDLADVGRRAAGLLAVRAAARGVRIDRPQDIDQATAIGEFRRALQVLVNLVGNAVRYSPDGGMVWIRTEREEGVSSIIVADQGRGIAMEDQARIFDKFERIDATEPGGSGLGLYIARRLARAMGGDLTVDSAPGQGARFTFTLPGGA